jgi:glycosyltransferase involved in cell wall biosynthesis
MKEFQRMRWKTPVFPYWIYAGFRECYYSKRSKKPLHLSYVLAYQRMIREVIGGARAVFPNSHSEWKAIESEAKVGNLKVRVIPCGVDVIKGVALSNRQDVLCIGRVEPRKNQVCIQEAFMECSANNDRLVFVGAVNRAHAGYAAQFEEGCLDTSIQHLGELPHEELMRVLNSAKGLVLGSFFETTGLVVMEALSRGVRVAMTDSPVARELYGESVIFINPYKKESVTVGIREILSEEISRNSWKGHSWEKVSELILQSISEYIA